MSYFVSYLPVTTGNDLKLYVDGQDYGRDLRDDIASASSLIMLTGLHFMADYRLVRTGAPSDAKSALGLLLADAARRGVEIFLIVNQFWKDEQEVRWWNSPIRAYFSYKGEIIKYLPETYKLFQMLAPYKNIHCRTDIHPHSDIIATHHQKTVVIDDRVAYLGGIDLTYLDGDRWDTPAHQTKAGTKLRATDRTQKYWHDVHMRVRASDGRAVEFVRDNFVQRWTYGHLHVLRKTSGGVILGEREKTRPPLPDYKAKNKKLVYPEDMDKSATSTVQIVRSMPRPAPFLPTELYGQVYSRSPRQLYRSDLKQRIAAADYKRQKPKWNRSNDSWEHSAKDAYILGIRSAKKYVYLENQWVADEGIWAELETAARRNRKNADFRIILMVPYEGLFAAGAGSNQELWIDDEIEDVMAAGRDQRVFGLYALSPDRPGQGVVRGQIYVHSKIMIVDDEWSLIGSANAGGISLEGVRTGRDQPDTELSASILDKSFATAFRQKLWTEHLGRPVAATYDANDADAFRTAANTRKHRITYDPRYAKVLRSSSTPDAARFRSGSRIVSTFPNRMGDGIPPTLVRATFKAEVVPAVPAGWRAWYRWKVEVGRVEDSYESRHGERWDMRSIRCGGDDSCPARFHKYHSVARYSDQDTVYIGEKTARVINAATSDIISGLVLCRVAFRRFDAGPPSANAIDTLLLEYRCQFMNEDFARANHPDFVTYGRSARMPREPGSR